MSVENKKEDEMITIKKEALTWVTVEGFVNLYFSHLEPGGLYKTAYEKAEQDFQKIYKYRRYRDYTSFIKAKWNYTARLLSNLKKETINPNTK